MDNTNKNRYALHQAKMGKQMKILQNSGVPIYKRVVSLLKDNIICGAIDEGEYLPSICELAKDLRISVITTMKAYEQLCEDGLISPVQGKRYKVNLQDRGSSLLSSRTENTAKSQSKPNHTYSTDEKR